MDKNEIKQYNLFVRTFNKSKNSLVMLKELQKRVKTPLYRNMIQTQISILL